MFKMFARFFLAKRSFRRRKKDYTSRSLFNNFLNFRRFAEKKDAAADRSKMFFKRFNIEAGQTKLVNSVNRVFGKTPPRNPSLNYSIVAEIRAKSLKEHGFFSTEFNVFAANFGWNF